MNKGFTLIELLVVIAIVCILIVIICASLSNAKNIIIEKEKCDPKWTQCTFNCSSDGWLTTLEELDICVKKCDIQRESCLLLEK